MSGDRNLGRFVVAQNARDHYATASAEIARGAKLSHWMWFVFPQIIGLASSAQSLAYAIADLEEAHSYLAHPVLGRRLREITALANEHVAKSARDIFSSDDVKFHSCMTLFSLAAAGESVFKKALQVFFAGQLDERTQAILALQAAAPRADRHH